MVRSLCSSSNSPDLYPPVAVCRLPRRWSCQSRHPATLGSMLGCGHFALRVHCVGVKRAVQPMPSLTAFSISGRTCWSAKSRIRAAVRPWLQFLGAVEIRLLIHHATPPHLGAQEIVLHLMAGLAPTSAGKSNAGRRCLVADSRLDGLVECNPLALVSSCGHDPSVERGIQPFLVWASTGFLRQNIQRHLHWPASPTFCACRRWNWRHKDTR